jgi:hypothetical protein
MLAAMRCPLAVLLLLVASCAKGTNTPAGAGGAAGVGGAGGATSSTTASGVGGAVGFDAGPPPVDAGACQPFVETFMPACVACLAASCCPQALACLAVSDCFGAVSCGANCPTGVPDGGNTCVMACAQNYPMAEPSLSAMTACLHASCASVCPF